MVYLRLPSNVLVLGVFTISKCEYYIFLSGIFRLILSPIDLDFSIKSQQRNKNFTPFYLTISFTRSYLPTSDVPTFLIMVGVQAEVDDVRRGS